MSNQNYNISSLVTNDKNYNKRWPGLKLQDLKGNDGLLLIPTIETKGNLFET